MSSKHFDGRKRYLRLHTYIYAYRVVSKYPHILISLSHIYIQSLSVSLIMHHVHVFRIKHLLNIYSLYLFLRFLPFAPSVTLTSYGCNLCQIVAALLWFFLSLFSCTSNQAMLRQNTLTVYLYNHCPKCPLASRSTDINDNSI